MGGQSKPISQKSCYTLVHVQSLSKKKKEFTQLHTTKVIHNSVTPNHSPMCLHDVPSLSCRRLHTLLSFRSIQNSNVCVVNRSHEIVADSHNFHFCTKLDYTRRYHHGGYCA